jgi:hypothetical protein
MKPNLTHEPGPMVSAMNLMTDIFDFGLSRHGLVWEFGFMLLGIIAFRVLNQLISPKTKRAYNASFIKRSDFIVPFIVLMVAFYYQLNAIHGVMLNGKLQMVSVSGLMIALVFVAAHTAINVKRSSIYVGSVVTVLQYFVCLGVIGGIFLGACLFPLILLWGWLTANHVEEKRVYDIGPEVNGIPMTWL